VGQKEVAGLLRPEQFYVINAKLHTGVKRGISRKVCTLAQSYPDLTSDTSRAVIWQQSTALLAANNDSS
jgi:hypothetical protein